MVFSTVTFLFYFLPLFLICYFALPFKNAVLLLASLLFYAWGEPQNLPLLLGSLLLNYLCGLAIGSARARGTSALPAFMAGIGLNLAFLGYFKYFNFAAATLASLAADAGIALPLPERVALPLGISFFTFHAISYLADVYRGKTAAERHIFALAMYIVMFPQLIAGPIIRFATVARQLHHRRHTMARVALGFRLFIFGLAQKVLIANTVALGADRIFSLPASELGMATAWLGIACYTLQIYFDFFGYSNMAIGLGLVTGFTFPRNFDYPYIARSVTEFWQRWHLSLSRWFRDYLYIPLGGNRHGMLRTSLNLFTVFLLCGLWHGANWTFIAWGLYHGVFLVLERAGLKSWIARLPGLLQHGYALLVVMVGWVVFRSDTLSQASDYLLAMAGAGPVHDEAASITRYLHGAMPSALLVGVMASTPVFGAVARALRQQASRLRAPAGLRSVGAGVATLALPLLFFILAMITLASGAYNPFIYFRF